MCLMLRHLFLNCTVLSAYVRHSVLIRSFDSLNGTGRCSVDQCYGNTWAMLAQSKFNILPLSRCLQLQNTTTVQITHNLNKPRMRHACCLHVTRVLLSWRGKLFSYTHVHVWVHVCTPTNSFTHACAYTHMKCLYVGAFC